MSGLEIERKFLIKKGGSWKEAAFSSSHIKQGYMPCESATVRVRTRDDRSWLTIRAIATVLDYRVMSLKRR